MQIAVYIIPFMDISILTIHKCFRNLFNRSSACVKTNFSTVDQFVPIAYQSYIADYFHVCELRNRLFNNLQNFMHIDPTDMQKHFPIFNRYRNIRTAGITHHLLRLCDIAQ